MNRFLNLPISSENDVSDIEWAFLIGMLMGQYILFKAWVQVALN